MTIYIIHMVFILLLGVILSPNKSNMRKAVFIILNAAIFIYISTIRSATVGADTHQFVSAFRSINNINGTHYSRDLEAGFTWLCKIIGNYSQDYHFYFFSISFIMFSLTCYFICKNSKDVILSVFLFCSLNFFSFYLMAPRQAISMSIILLFVEIALKRKHNILYLLGVFLASLFHTSAIATLILIFFMDMRIEKKTFICVIIGSIVAVFAADYIFSFANIFLPYEVYEGSRFYTSSLLGALYNLLIWLAFLFIGAKMFIFSNKGKYIVNAQENTFKERRRQFIRNILSGKIILHKNKINELSINFLLWCSALSVVIAAISLKISVCYRMTYYFSIFNIILLPDVFERINERKTKQSLKFLAIILSFITWLIVALFRPEWYKVIPFTTQ